MLKNPITLGTAERKILLVFLYYITLGVFVLTSFTLATKNLNQNAHAVIEYFDCEKMVVTMLALLRLSKIL